jgi:hypothetical protein
LSTGSPFILFRWILGCVLEILAIAHRRYVKIKICHMGHSQSIVLRTILSKFKCRSCLLDMDEVQASCRLAKLATIFYLVRDESWIHLLVLQRRGKSSRLQECIMTKDCENGHTRVHHHIKLFYTSSPKTAEKGTHCCLGVPPCCLAIILGNSHSFAIATSEIVHGMRISECRRPPIPPAELFLLR